MLNLCFLVITAEVSSIPVVDDNDSLIDIYSRSDITALAKDKAYAQIHLDDMTVHQVNLSSETKIHHMSHQITSFT
jgi:predicted transcriptional regulator